MSQTTLELPEVIVEQQPEISAAVITLRGTLTSEDYRRAMEANYDLCKFPHIKNWLQDNTEAGLLSIEDQQWVSNVLIPLAAQFVDKIAIVISKDVFRKFAAKNILDKKRGELNFQYFPNLEEAKNWLKS
ncbi:STAS/SEC14 domain-containing protein [Marivirga sp. S37H4]|uniref:STAS/SEC14 domain-containing protein n=1 Tax=Marivirga aurantiaca TaxID=2802615 RepID=A0A934X0M3_9BACT|nr:STAS/SEC14 domain-containing protein [Marivirga aurantiaca]MBK6266748.1 STAS/SEC14 domain-containing protein [Marivirga aurantiaca]